MQGLKQMVIVDFSCVHVVQEVYEKTVPEDFATPEVSWKGDGCDTTVVLKRIEHGFCPKWFKTNSMDNSWYSMHAKDINFGKLVVFEECEIRLQKDSKIMLGGDLVVASKLTKTFLQTENLVFGMLKDKDELIMRFKSIQSNPKLIKVCAFFIEISVRQLVVCCIKTIPSTIE